MKENLEKLTLDMYQSGIGFRGALEEFQRVFILTVLRDQKFNQVKTAKILGMHRNTLLRAIRELNIDLLSLRASRRRPPMASHAFSARRKSSAR